MDKLKVFGLVWYFRSVPVAAPANRRSPTAVVAISEPLITGLL